MEYSLDKPWLTLDPWQKEYIETEGNCFLLCGRQSGKTAAMSIKFGKRAAERPKRVILMIAFTERQAYNLFFKTLMFLEAVYPHLISRKKEKPTKHEIHLKNGSLIMCYACGLSGEGIRTYTVTDLVIDEAAPMSREVFISVMPMLSVTGGSVDMSSTPRGKEGYFYDCSKREDFTKFYVSAEDCPRHKKEFLESEKASMSKLEYAQEYLARFLDDLKRFFPDELIKKCMTQKRRENISVKRTYFLGIDVARMGEDEVRFEIIDRTDRKMLFHVDNILMKKVYLNEVYNKTLELDKQYNFYRIYIDTGGIGIGIFDFLLEDPQTRKKIVPINNREMVLDKDEKRKKRLLKEDLYNNLLGLMERGEIQLLDDEDLMESLKSVQFEYVISPKKLSVLRIFGNYTHIVEGLIRATWCVKDKHLSIWAR